MKGRQRGRNGGGGGGGHGGGGKPRPPGRNPNFDGNNNRPRGNAQQLMEKYLALARDSASAGDRVLAENYFQHADHYYRVLNARFEQNGQPRRDGQGNPQQYERQGGYNDRPYDSDPGPQHNQGGGYGGQSHHQPQHQQPQHQQPQNQQPQHQQPQHQHYNAEPEQQSGNEAEIALPRGVLPEAPALDTASEPQEGGESQESGGGDANRSRDRGRRRRGRGDRPAANAGE